MFPFSQLDVSIKHPALVGYIENPQTFGNHIRNRRLELKLSQPKAAELLGVEFSTYRKWEWGIIANPLPKHREKIIEFLGYHPECLKPKRRSTKQIAPRTA
jgi:transcriptional regulator with XRE-family HTH domain